MKTLTIDWLNKCRCGNKSHTVKTARGNESGLWDDDAVKCNSCGRGGVIQVCEGQARVLWETDEEMAEGKPMSTITKERIEQLANGNNICKVTREERIELARIALASLEAEAVGYVDAEYAELLRSGHIESCSVYAEAGEGCITLYAAPPAPVEDTDIQRKAATHDVLCEKYNVESLADFVEWQRNHIAELEAAPPAPVGKGETAVMPDYPGYVMTQRECFQAGNKAGLAEAVTTANKSPEGWVACSERMPDPESEYRICAYTPTPHEDVRFRFVPASLFKSVCRDATHWQYMLPPAAPQQEVTHALAKGMERYGDAMQELANKEVK